MTAPRASSDRCRWRLTGAADGASPQALPSAGRGCPRARQAGRGGEAVSMAERKPQTSGAAGRAAGQRGTPGGPLAATPRRGCCRAAIAVDVPGGRSPAPEAASRGTVDARECRRRGVCGVERRACGAAWRRGARATWWSVSGAVRRRFFRAGSGPASRVEVEVMRARRVIRRGTGRMITPRLRLRLEGRGLLGQEAVTRDDVRAPGRSREPASAPRSRASCRRPGRRRRRDGNRIRRRRASGAGNHRSCTPETVASWGSS